MGAKLGEINYFNAIGEEGIRHSLNLPFSSNDCGKLLSDIGLIMSLLPPPPAEILDFGCGTGWTSCFFAKRGYNVVGVDISPSAIHHAEATQKRLELKNLKFMVSDFNNVNLNNSFDCVVFHSSLHHSNDHEAAIKSAFNALRSYGVCITCEPGIGHSKVKSTIEAVEKYGVTEKDMPPKLIIETGKKVGFKRFEIYPDMYSVRQKVNERITSSILKDNVFLKETFLIAIILRKILSKRDSGIVKLVKGDPDSSTRTGLAAKLNVELKERKVRQGEVFSAKVKIKNIGRSLWFPTTANIGAVHLGCHLMDNNKKILEFDFFRHKLTQGDGRQIPPKETLNFNIHISVPARGDYILDFDLVAESVCWFADNGSKSVKIPVKII